MSGSTTAQPLEYENLGYNAPDGMMIGRASTEKWSFGGIVPTSVSTIMGAAAVTSFATTLAISTAGIFGFNTSTQANIIVNAILELQRKGFIA